MILDMLRVRDFDVQYACTRALLHLIRHNGEVDWGLCFACFRCDVFVRLPSIDCVEESLKSLPFACVPCVAPPPPHHHPQQQQQQRIDDDVAAATYTTLFPSLSQHFSESMSEGDRRATILQLTCLVRPVRERAARLIQAKLKQFRDRQLRGAAWMYDREHSSFRRQRGQQPLKTAYEQNESQQQYQHQREGQQQRQQQQDQQQNHTSNGLASTDDASGGTGPTSPSPKDSWCVQSRLCFNQPLTTKICKVPIFF